MNPGPFKTVFFTLVIIIMIMIMITIRKIIITIMIIITGFHITMSLLKITYPMCNLFYLFVPQTATVIMNW